MTALRLVIHLLIALQILAWSVAMVFLYLRSKTPAPSQSLEGYIFLGIIAFLLCFVPALRMSKRVRHEPFALLMCCLPAMTFAIVFLADTYLNPAP